MEKLHVFKEARNQDRFATSCAAQTVMFTTSRTFVSAIADILRGPLKLGNRVLIERCCGSNITSALGTASCAM